MRKKHVFFRKKHKCFFRIASLLIVAALIGKFSVIPSLKSRYLLTRGQGSLGYFIHQ